jgi:hypothetical protein
MPDKKHHSAKWHRCVEKVRAAGGVKSPEAVCTAALGDESYEEYEDNDILEKIDKLFNTNEKIVKNKFTEKEISAIQKILKLNANIEIKESLAKILERIYAGEKK